MFNNIQYSYYLNEHYGLSGSERLEFRFRYFDAWIYFLNPKTTQQIFADLERLGLKEGFDYFLSSPYVLTLRNYNVINIYTDYLKRQIINKQKAKEIDNNHYKQALGFNTYTNISLEKLFKYFPTAKDKVDKINQEEFDRIELHSVDYDSALELYNLLVEKFFKIKPTLPTHLVWVDIFMDPETHTKKPFVGISLDALKVLEEICQDNKPLT